MPKAMRHWICIVRLWLEQRHGIEWRLENWWRLNEQKKAVCVRCGYVYPHVTFDLPECTCTVSGPINGQCPRHPPTGYAVST